MIFLKTESKKQFIGCTNFLQSKKLPHFRLRGKVGQLSERKRVLCWSIYIISLWSWSMVIISIDQLNIISQQKLAKPHVPRAGVSVSCVEAVDVLPDVCLYGLEVFPHCTEKDQKVVVEWVAKKRHCFVTFTWQKKAKRATKEPPQNIIQSSTGYQAAMKTGYRISDYQALYS